MVIAQTPDKDVDRQFSDRSDGIFLKHHSAVFDEQGRGNAAVRFQRLNQDVGAFCLANAK